MSARRAFRRRSRSCGADRRGRRAALRLPRIQLLDVGRVEERDRLGLAPARPALRRQASARSWAPPPAWPARARAQYDLRRSCVFLDMHPINKPEVLIGQAQTKFDADGNLTDEAARGFIRDMMRSPLADNWTPADRPAMTNSRREERDGSGLHRQGRADHRRRQRHRPRHGARLSPRAAPRSSSSTAMRRAARRPPASSASRAARRASSPPTSPNRPRCRTM